MGFYYILHINCFTEDLSYLDPIVEGILLADGQAVKLGGPSHLFSQ